MDKLVRTCSLGNVIELLDTGEKVGSDVASRRQKGGGEAEINFNAGDMRRTVSGGHQG